MSGIVELLKAFDRKERAWLVRMALKPAALDQGFLNRVYKELDLTAPCSSTVWWGMDYHIDWLVAALHAFRNGWTVDELTTQKSMTNDDARITHSIEDFDFIIADKERIILIEAKAFGDWDPKRLEEKLSRLAKLSGDGKVPNSGSDAPVQLHLILTSIDNTPDLSDIPSWIFPGGKPLYIKLDIDPGQFMRVARSDKDGKISKKGTLWKVAKDRTIKEG